MGRNRRETGAPRAVSGVLAGVALLAVAAAARADPQGLSPNVPVEIEDALVTPVGGLQLQFDQRYIHDPSATSSGDLFALEPVVKLGVVKGLQVDVGLPYDLGTASAANSGLTGIDALYNFNPDSKWIPALAVHGYVQTGYGHDSPSTQYTLRGMATKYLGSTDQAPRLHVNLTWTHVTGPAETARADLYSVAVGYSMLVTADTAVVVDVVHGQKTTRHQDQDLVDVGFVHQFSKDWSVAIGGGAGVAEDAPERRIFFALQRNFTLFGG